MLLDTPAAQSMRKRLIEGMQAVIKETLTATDVQMEGVTAPKALEEVGTA